jgi:hypothetical protein
MAKFLSKKDQKRAVNLMRRVVGLMGDKGVKAQITQKEINTNMIILQTAKAPTARYLAMSYYPSTGVAGNVVIKLQREEGEYFVTEKLLLKSKIGKNRIKIEAFSRKGERYEITI